MNTIQIQSPIQKKQLYQTLKFPTSLQTNMKNFRTKNINHKTTFCTKKLDSDQKIKALYQQLQKTAFTEIQNPEFSTQYISANYNTKSPRSLLKLEKKTKKPNTITKTKQMNEQIIQNRVKIMDARKQLENRMKKKKVKRSERSQSDFDQPYTEMVKKLSRSQKILSLYDQEYIRNLPDVQDQAPYGIQFYQQLKDNKAILSYTLQKIQHQKTQALQQKIKQQEHNNFILQLYRRKFKNRKKIFKISQKWQKDLYQSDIKNIDKISGRMRKIYTRVNRKQISRDSQQKLSKSPILRTQRKILDQINFGAIQSRLSKQSKSQLIRKFNQILKQTIKYDNYHKDNSNQIQDLQLINLNNNRRIKSMPK